MLRGVAAENMSERSMGARLAREGKELFADRAEQAAVSLCVFGDLAPEIRKPANIKLPRPQAHTDDPVTDLNVHEQIRASIYAAREEERKAHEPLRHSGKSSYDPSTGTISVGQNPASEAVTIQLHNPETGAVDSVMILGKPQTGKSNS